MKTRYKILILSIYCAITFSIFKEYIFTYSKEYLSYDKHHYVLLKSIVLLTIFLLSHNLLKLLKLKLFSNKLFSYEFTLSLIVSSFILQSLFYNNESYFKNNFPYQLVYNYSIDDNYDEPLYYGTTIYKKKDLDKVNLKGNKKFVKGRTLLFVESGLFLDYDYAKNIEANILSSGYWFDDILTLSYYCLFYILEIIINCITGISLIWKTIIFFTILTYLYADRNPNLSENTGD